MTVLDAVALSALVHAGELSPREIVEAAIQRAENLNGSINAIVEPAYEVARELAAGLGDARLIDFPLAGVPMALKDLFCGREGDTAYQGNAVLKSLDHRYSKTNSVARRFSAAGAVTLGRTHSPEFGYGNCTAAAETSLYGATRNPWSLEHTAMGSSGGAAAAVAAGLVPIAHGSDGGGSIRMPASACGLVGLKPSRGRISNAPAGEMWSGGCSDGVLSRTVRDTALVLDVLAGVEPGDPYSAPPHVDSYLSHLQVELSPLRIGVVEEFAYVDTHQECRHAVRKVSELLGSLGHNVERTHPNGLDSAHYLYDYILLIRTALATELNGLAKELGREWNEGDMENGSWLQYQRGRRLSAVDFDAAVRRLHSWTRDVVRWWYEGHDILVLPTLATPPPRLGFLTEGNETLRRSRLAATIPFTPPFNVTGQPAISIPAHWTSDGLPVGVQLVAGPGREDLILNLAVALERELRWDLRIPPFFAL